MADFVPVTTRGLLPATAYVVPSDAPETLKKQARKNKAVYGDLIQICDGDHDEVELLASINAVGSLSTPYRVGGVVIWLAGTYQLDNTLTIPPVNMFLIQGEGAQFNYTPDSGDGIVITGMLRSRIHLGFIVTDTTGAALKVYNALGVSCLYSELSFTGLGGTSQHGTGLLLSPTIEGICTDRFIGGDIYGFDYGVHLLDAAAGKKCDTNTFSINHTRQCNHCIKVDGTRTDDNIWVANVAADLDNSIAYETGAAQEKIFLVMEAGATGAKALVLDSDAYQNIIEVHPPLSDFTWEDNSGNYTNNIIGAGETLPHLIGGVDYLHIPTNGGWAQDNTGTGAAGFWPFSMLVNTGATASSRGSCFINLRGFSAGSNNIDRMNWDKKLILIFNYTRANSDAEAVARVQLKESNSEGALAALGIGLQIDNLSLVGESYGTELGTVSLGVTMAAYTEYQIMIILYPGEKIEWWVNGVLKATQSTAAKIPTGPAGASSYFVHSIVNGGSGGVDAYSFIMQPKMWQER